MDQTLLPVQPNFMGAKNYPQFILIGDSIVQRTSFLRDGFSFGSGLEEYVQRRFDVINRGLSGYNTANAVKIFEHLIPSSSCAKVDYLLLLFGSNDSCLPDSPSNQHVPLSKYRANIKTMLRHPSVRAHGATILLVTPPPVNEVQLEVEDLQKGYFAVTRHQKVTAEYANAIREIAAEFEHQGVILIDLWTAIMKEAIRQTQDYLEGGCLLGSKESGDSGGLRNLLVDGIHLSGAGYKVFLNEVLPTIGKGWDDEGDDKPSYIFPPWKIAPRIQ